MKRRYLYPHTRKYSTHKLQTNRTYNDFKYKFSDSTVYGSKSKEYRSYLYKAFVMYYENSCYIVEEYKKAEREIKEKYGKRTIY